jgi:hypothetical protein
MSVPFSFFIALITGTVILLGYFFPIGPLAAIRSSLLNVAVILAGFALVVGVLNLLNVHWAKIKSDSPGKFNSLALIVSLLATVGVVGFFEPTSDVSLWILNYIHLPLEGSLMAILAVILLYAGVRLLRRRFNLLSVIFLVTAVLVLLGTTPLFLFPEVQVFGTVRDYIVQVLSVGGARGILIGVSLGTLATGVRIFIGSDRPYSG